MVMLNLLIVTKMKRCKSLLCTKQSINNFGSQYKILGKICKSQAFPGCESCSTHSKRSSVCGIAKAAGSLLMHYNAQVVSVRSLLPWLPSSTLNDQLPYTNVFMGLCENYLGCKRLVFVLLRDGLPADQ